MENNNKVQDLYEPLLEPDHSSEHLPTLDDLSQTLGWNDNMRLMMEDRYVSRRYVPAHEFGKKDDGDLVNSIKIDHIAKGICIEKQPVPKKGQKPQPPKMIKIQTVLGSLNKTCLPEIQKWPGSNKLFDEKVNNQNLQAAFPDSKSSDAEKHSELIQAIPELKMKTLQDYDYFAKEKEHFESFKYAGQNWIGGDTKRLKAQKLTVNEMIKSQEKKFFTRVKKAEPDKIIDDCNTQFSYGFQQVVFLNENKILETAIIRTHSHSDNCIDMHIIQEDKEDPGNFLSEDFCVLESAQEHIGDEYQWATFAQNGSKLFFNKITVSTEETEDQNDDGQQSDREQYKIQVIEFDLIERNHKIVQQMMVKAEHFDHDLVAMVFLKNPIGKLDLSNEKKNWLEKQYVALFYRVTQQYLQKDEKFFHLEIRKMDNFQKKLFRTIDEVDMKHPDIFYYNKKENFENPFEIDHNLNEIIFFHTDEADFDELVVLKIEKGGEVRDLNFLDESQDNDTVMKDYVTLTDFTNQLKDTQKCDPHGIDCKIIDQHQGNIFQQQKYGDKLERFIESFNVLAKGKTRISLLHDKVNNIIRTLAQEKQTEEVEEEISAQEDDEDKGIFDQMTDLYKKGFGEEEVTPSRLRRQRTKLDSGVLRLRSYALTDSVKTFDQLEGINQLLVIPELDGRVKQGHQIILSRSICNKITTYHLIHTKGKGCQYHYILSQDGKNITKLMDKSMLEEFPKVIFDFKRTFTEEIARHMASPKIYVNDTHGTTFQSIDDLQENVRGYFIRDEETKQIEYRMKMFDEVDLAISEVTKKEQNNSMWIICPRVRYEEDDSQVQILVLVELENDQQKEWNKNLVKPFKIKEFHIALFDMQAKKLLLTKKLEKPRRQLEMCQEDCISKFVCLEPCANYQTDKKDNIISFYQLYIKYNNLEMKKVKKKEGGGTSEKVQRYWSNLAVEIQEFKLTQPLNPQNIPKRKGQKDLTPGLTIDDIHIELISKKLVLPLNPTAEEKTRLEFYPMLDENCLIIGTQMIVLNSEGLFHSYEMPNLAEKDYIYNKQGKTFSNYKFYGREMLILEAKLTDPMIERKLLTLYESGHILSKQIEILLNSTSFMFEDWVEAQRRSVYQKGSALEILGGYTQINFLADDYKSLSKALEDTFTQSLKCVPTLIERVLETCANTQLMREIYNKMNFIMDPKNTDITMGVNQKSLIEQTMEVSVDSKDNDKRALSFALEIIMSREHHMARYSMIMAQIENIVTLGKNQIEDASLGKQMEQFFKKNDRLNQGRVRLEISIEDERFEHYCQREPVIVNDSSPVHYDYYTGYVHDLIIHFDKIHSATQDFEIKHTWINYNKINLQRKLDIIRSGESRVPQLVNEIDIARMNLAITTNRHIGVITEQKVIRNLIDTQFEAYSQQYQEYKFYIYFGLFYLPLLGSIYKPQRIPDLPVHIHYNIITCLITQTCFFMEEVLITYAAWGDLLVENWLFEIMRHLFSFSIIVYLLSRFLDAEEIQYAPLIFEEGGSAQQDINLTTHCVEGQSCEPHYHNIFINFLIVTFGFFKLLRYMTVFSELGQIILMVKQCVIDVLSFVIFLGLWLSYFTLNLRILSTSFNESQEYKNVPESVQYLIQAFLNSIGEMALPNYSLWYKVIQENHDNALLVEQAYFMIYLIWGFWILNQFLMQIIIMNFLIALINQGYEQQKVQELKTLYLNRCIQNYESLLVRQFFIKLHPITSQIVYSNPENEGFSRDSNIGMVQKILTKTKKKNEEMENRIVEKIEGMLKPAIKVSPLTMDKEIQQEFQSLRNDSSEATKDSKQIEDAMKILRVAIKKRFSEVENEEQKLGSQDKDQIAADLLRDQDKLNRLEEEQKLIQQQKEHYDQAMLRKYKDLDNQKKASPEAVNLIFDQFDIDKNGTLDFEETFTFFKNLSGVDINEEDFKNKFNAIDLDGNGSVDKDELTAFLKEFYNII